MEDEDNVGRADCTPSPSLSISLSLTLPLSVAIPVPRCACGGAARRRGPAAGMRGKSKGVKSMGATGKMFEYPAATGHAQNSKRRHERQVVNVRSGSPRRQRQQSTRDKSTRSKLWRSGTAEGRKKERRRKRKMGSRRGRHFIQCLMSLLQLCLM